MQIFKKSIGLINALLILGLWLITTIDVIGRYFFNAPLRGAFELSQANMGLLIYAGLVLVSLDNSNISATFIVNAMRGRFRMAYTGILAIATSISLLVLAYSLWITALYLLKSHDITMFLRIPNGPITVMLAIFTVISAVLYIRIALVGNSSPDVSEV